MKIRIQEKEQFKPGMSVTAEIATRFRTNVLTVPIASATVRLPKETDCKKAAKVAAADPPATNSTPTKTEQTEIRSRDSRVRHNIHKKKGSKCKL